MDEEIRDSCCSTLTWIRSQLVRSCCCLLTWNCAMGFESIAVIPSKPYRKCVARSHEWRRVPNKTMMILTGERYVYRHSSQIDACWFGKNTWTRYHITFRGVFGLIEYSRQQRQNDRCAAKCQCQQCQDGFKFLKKNILVQGTIRGMVGSEETERVKLINCRTGGYSKNKVIKPSLRWWWCQRHENPKYYHYYWLNHKYNLFITLQNWHILINDNIGRARQEKVKRLGGTRKLYKVPSTSVYVLRTLSPRMQGTKAADWFGTGVWRYHNWYKVTRYIYVPLFPRMWVRYSTVYPLQNKPLSS